MEQIMETAKKQIDELLTQKDIIIVAIDGKCTSGKTTLASQLERSMTAMYFTWMTSFSVRNSEYRSDLQRWAAMWTMKDSMRKCCFR